MKKLLLFTILIFVLVFSIQATAEKKTKKPEGKAEVMAAAGSDLYCGISENTESTTRW